MYINNFPDQPWIIITDFLYKTVKGSLAGNFIVIINRSCRY